MIRQPGHGVVQAPLVDGPNLFEQNETVPTEGRILSADGHMDGEPGLVLLGGDGGDNHGGAVLVADVVLEDEHRPHAALFRSDHRRQVCEKHVATPNGGFYSPGRPVGFHASSASWTFT